MCLEKFAIENSYYPLASFLLYELSSSRVHLEIDVHTDEIAEIVVDALVHTDCVLSLNRSVGRQNSRPLAVKVS